MTISDSGSRALASSRDLSSWLVAAALNFRHRGRKVNLRDVVGDSTLVIASTALRNHLLGHLAASLLKDVPVDRVVLGSDSRLLLRLSNTLDGDLLQWDGGALLNHSVVAFSRGDHCVGGDVASRLCDWAEWVNTLETIPPGVDALPAIRRSGTAHWCGRSDGGGGSNNLFGISVSPLAPALGVPGTDLPGDDSSDIEVERTSLERGIRHTVDSEGAGNSIELAIFSGGCHDSDLVLGDL